MAKPFYGSKQNRGIIPNIIHSLDAANISILVNKMIDDDIKMNLLTIHDAFATNANYVDDLTYQIKLAFLVIYSNKEPFY
jgi:DNA-directed RNA polymerase